MSQTLFGLGEEQRNRTFTRLLQDNNAKCCLSHRALAAWRAISARREPGTSQQREPFVRIPIPPEPNAGIELLSCRELLATSKMLLERAGSKSKLTGCRINDTC